MSLELFFIITIAPMSATAIALWHLGNWFETRRETLIGGAAKSISYCVGVVAAAAACFILTGV